MNNNPEKQNRMKRRVIPRVDLDDRVARSKLKITKHTHMSRKSMSIKDKYCATRRCALVSLCESVRPWSVSDLLNHMVHFDQIMHHFAGNDQFAFHTLLLINLQSQRVLHITVS